MWFEDIAEALLDEPMHGVEGSVRNNRRRIDKPERHVLDDPLADRLDGLGMDPWLPTVTGVTVMHNGYTFDMTPLREHWAFASIAKSKAADFTTKFMAFRQVTDTGRFQGFVLRPELRKGGPGELLETINRVSSDYSNVMTAAVKDGLAWPIATFIHIRYDLVLQMWDVHLHVVADVPEDPEERFFSRLCRRFSTPKTIQLKDVGAWVNYCSTWAIDHRDIVNWPDDALLELWNLRGVHLLRKGGAFARFCRSLKGKTLTRQGEGVTIEDKPTKASRTGPGRAPHDPDQSAYTVMRIDGEAQYVALHRRPREKGGDRASAAPNEGRMKSTTSTGPISTTAHGSPTAMIANHSTLSPVAARSRVRRGLRLWTKVWPYGGHISGDVAPDDPRLPRPVRRRLAAMLSPRAPMSPTKP